MDWIELNREIGDGARNRRRTLQVVTRDLKGTVTCQASQGQE